MDSPPPTLTSNTIEQIHYYLSHNTDFWTEIEAVRRRFNVDQWTQDKPGTETRHLPPDDIADDFRAAILQIADRICAQGNWYFAVYDLITGNDFESCFYPQTGKFISIVQQEDYIEMRVYGNQTISELRDAVDKMRKIITRKYKNQKLVQHKPEFDKYRRAYELRRKGEGTPQAAIIMSKEYPNIVIADTDISAYDLAIRREIRNIYAT